MICVNGNRLKRGAAIRANQRRIAARARGADPCLRALAQGEEYFARGSILVARQYFQHAADSGLAESALRLAATYNPGELQHIQAAGVVADRDLARKWYERARELGAAEAEGAVSAVG